MVRPKRSEKLDLPAAIKTAAWQQIAAEGAPALSLRAIARSLGITAPAIYNYYPSRDDLVTALIVDAYLSFGDAQHAAAAALPADDLDGRLRALGQAYREWAVTYPERYQLIFGTPLPGYLAPLDETQPAAARSLMALIDVVASALASGQLRLEAIPALDDALAEELAQWQAVHPVGDSRVLYLALVIWSRVHGMVGLEIGCQYPSFLQSPGAFYSRELDQIVQLYLYSQAD